MDARVHGTGVHDDAEGAAADQNESHNAHGRAPLVAGGETLKDVVEHALAVEVLGTKEGDPLSDGLAGLVQGVREAAGHHHGAGLLALAHHVADLLGLKAAHGDQVGQKRTEQDHTENDHIGMRHFDLLFHGSILLEQLFGGETDRSFDSECTTIGKCCKGILWRFFGAPACFIALF